MIKKNLYISILLTFIAPSIGMLNIAQGKKSIGYFFLSIAAMVSGLISLHYGFLHNFSTAAVLFSAKLIVNLVAAIHSYKLIKYHNGLFQPKLYSRWYMIIFITLGLTAVNLVVRFFLFEPFMVFNVAMAPALNEGALVLALKPTFYTIKHAINTKLFNIAETRPAIQKDDIVIYCRNQDVYTFLGNRCHNYMVARVVSQPGDKIKHINDKLYLNQQTKDFYIYNLEGLSSYAKLYESHMPKDKWLLTLDNDYSKIAFSVSTWQIYSKIEYILWDSQTRKFVGKAL